MSSFQEQILSNRQLTFVNGITHWVCGNGQWREDLALEEIKDFDGHHDVIQILPKPSQSEARRDPTGAFREYVHSYSRRDLTYPEDILHAFTGILRTLES